MRHAGRGSYSWSLHPESQWLIVVWMLAAASLRDIDRPQPILGPRRGKRGEAGEPGQSGFDADLLRWRDVGWAIETADGHRDVVAADQAISQRRAADGAESALGDLRTAVDRRRAPGEGEVLLAHTGKSHERSAAGLLAHPAMADAGACGTCGQHIAHGAALAATCQARRCLD